MSGLFETLSGAKGIRAQGRSEQNIAEFNAKVAEQEGKAAKIKSGFESIQQAKEAQRIKSRQIAGIGEAGGAGSPVALDISAEQAIELELENLLIGFEGEVALLRSIQKATGLRLQGQAARQASKSAARRANIQFGTQLLTGFAAAGGFGGSGPFADIIGTEL